MKQDYTSQSSKDFVTIYSDSIPGKNNYGEIKQMEKTPTTNTNPTNHDDNNNNNTHKPVL